MKKLFIIFFLFGVFELYAQKYYSYDYDLGGLEFGHNIELFKDKFIISTYDTGDTSPVNVLKNLNIQIDNPNIYSYKEYGVHPNSFITAISQGTIVDSKGNIYAAGIKPIDQPKNQLATCMRIKSNGEFDWNIDFPSYPVSAIRSIVYINDNSILMCSEEGISNTIIYNRLIWIDSTGTIIKEKTLPTNGLKFNQFNYIYPIADSGFLDVSTAVPPPIGVYTFWMNMRKLDKDGNILFNTLDYMDYSDNVKANGSPTLNGNFIGSKLIDTIYIDDQNNLINNPNVYGFYNNNGIKISEVQEPPTDSSRILPNYMFPLKNGDVLQLGYSFCGSEPQLNTRGAIARISPDGKFKWWRYIYDLDIMTGQGGSLFDGLELENGDLAFSGVVYSDSEQSNIWLLKTDSMGCITPGCTGYNIVLQKGTSVDNQNKETEIFFKVYPNPASSEATVSFFNTHQRKNSKISLSDINGKVLLEEFLNRNVQQISVPMQTLASGNYFIQYIANGEILQIEKVEKK